MTRTCSALSCKNRRGLRKESLQFFRFPLKNKEVLQSWLSNVNRKDFVPSKNSTLCSDHFKESDYLVRPGTYVRKLKPDAVPTLLLFTFHQDLQKKVSTPSLLEKRNSSNCINKQPMEVDDSIPEYEEASGSVPIPDCQETINPIENSSTSSSILIPEYQNISSTIKKVLKDHAYYRRTANSIESISTGIYANDIFLNKMDKEVQTDPIVVKEQMSIIKKQKNIVENQLRRKIRMLQQTIRLRDKYITHFKDLLKHLKKTGVLQLETENLLEEQFQEQSSDCHIIQPLPTGYHQSMQNLDF